MKVSIRTCNDYTPARITRELSAALAFVGDPIRKGQTVLLKVNMLSDRAPERAVTTHPAIISAVIDHVRSKGATPVVGDSPFPFISFDTIAKKTGIRDICEKKGVELLALTDPSSIPSHAGRLVKRFDLTSHVSRFDCIINMPKLKTHTFVVYTGAIKNLFGLIPGRGKPAMHLRFPKENHFGAMLLDLDSLIAPKVCLTVMDAIIGMEGTGPLNGNPRKIGLLLVGTSCLAIDTVATTITGLKPPYLALAASRGLPGSSLRDISLDQDIHPLIIPDFKPPPWRWSIGMLSFMRSWLVRYPVVDIPSCISCKRCAASCPNKAISMKTRYPSFDYGRCIRCYCCHEMCPEHAIRLKKTVLLRAATFVGGKQ